MSDPVEELRREAEKLQAEASKKVEEALRVERLQRLYPDLTEKVGRWGKVVYRSPSVNSLVTDYETRFNCGCCNDSPLELWPYIETPHGRVYSNPCGMFIGERHSGMRHAIPRAGWRQSLEKHGLPSELLDRVEKHFESQRNRAIKSLWEAEAVDEVDPFI